MKPDTYQQITDRIVAALEAGTRPWRRDWKVGADGGAAAGLALPRRANGEHYRGINVLLLWNAAGEQGFQSDRWFTFKQASDLGAKVRKGSKATQICFFKPLAVTRTNEAGEETDATIPLIRGYSVFNADQIDGLPARFASAPLAIVGGLERDEASEAALRSTGADIREGGERAFYSPSQDFVQMPDFQRFETASGFLATLAHELCHWSGGDARLARALRNQFGSKDYAFEELIAEIGAAFVCARLGIAGEHFDNHAAYVAGWLEKLKGDKRAIFKAASAAQAACDLVLANAGLVAPADADEDEAPAAPIAANDDRPAPVQGELAI
jgi:antirestriction protein ArdC